MYEIGARSRDFALLTRFYSQPPEPELLADFAALRQPSIFGLDLDTPWNVHCSDRYAYDSSTKLLLDLVTYRVFASRLSSSFANFSEHYTMHHAFPTASSTPFAPVRASIIGHKRLEPPGMVSLANVSKPDARWLSCVVSGRALGVNGPGNLTLALTRRLFP